MNWVAFIATGLTVLVVYAEQPGTMSDAERREAADRFDRAMVLLDQGDDRGALSELARLYEQTRHPQVLYNLALLYARAGRPVEAVRALDVLLARPAGLPPHSVAAASRIRDAQRRNVAYLRITTNVSALIEIDGVERGRAPMDDPMAVAAGRFVVTISRSGYLPAHRALTIAGETTRQIHVELRPTEQQMAHLAIRSPIPGADVLVDGQRVGCTPLAGTIRVQPGARRLELRRAGYRTAQREIVIDEGATVSLALDLDEDPRVAARGTLRLRISEPDADVFVDGRVRGGHREAWRLPVGPHRLRVERAGFFPSERMVQVPRGGETELRMTLIPTEETRRAYERRVSRWHTAGWINLASGAALLLGMGTWSLVNEGKLDDAREGQAVAAARFEGGPPCGPGSDATTPQYAECEAALRQADGDVNRHRNLRTVSLIGVGLGSALAAVGTLLLATAGDADRYRNLPSRRPGRWELSSLSALGGGGLQLHGSF